MKPYLRLLGDCHGQYDPYLKLAQKATYSIQLGDMGFKYRCLNNLSSCNHKVLAGNHDNYENVDGKFIKQTDHFLGDFGTYEIPDFFQIFFVRGGQSIDFRYRLQGYDWWPEEQLSYEKMCQAMDEYCKRKPDFVISHECPSRIIEYVSTLNSFDGEAIRPSATAQLLDQMFDDHRPKFWFFGHHHKSWSANIDGTEFRCLAELEFFDFLQGQDHL